MTVKSPAAKPSRLVAHYLLLGFATCLLCMTVFFVSSPSSSLKGVRAHSAHDWVTRPHLIYGTAWKEDDTARLVSEAIKMGFRYVDTACQPKHYNEAGVGNGWTAAAQELGLVRKDLWLQTKFTPIAGQDPNNVPYDRSLPIDEQAKESLQVSLTNLKTDYLDSWVLHSNPGSFEDLMRVWRVMEAAVDQGTVHMIGISNIYDLDTFRLLYQQARHKPSVRQEITRYYLCIDRFVARLQMADRVFVVVAVGTIDLVWKLMLGVVQYSFCKTGSTTRPTLTPPSGTFARTAE